LEGQVGLLKEIKEGLKEIKEGLKEINGKSQMPIYNIGIGWLSYCNNAYWIT
jgi:hypothetical protein